MAVAAVIGLAVAAVGAGVQFIGQQKQAAAQRKQNRLRRRQADLEAARKRRAVLREATIARAQTIAQASGQGVGLGGSTIAGATAGQSNVAAGNTLGINQGVQIGQQITSAQNQESRAGSLVSFGQGLSSLGPAAGDAFRQS